jgi:TRAP-type C4-dicarboxylate transport system permease small subunit
MKTLEWLVHKFSMWLQISAGIALTFVMFLTGSDIVARAFRHPIPGAFEIISAVGGLVVGLAVPVTSLTREHVIVDVVVNLLGARMKLVLRLVTRVIAVGLFALLTFSIIKAGFELKASGEVTAVLNLPVYPVFLAMAVAFLVEILVLIADAARTGEEGKDG